MTDVYFIGIGGIGMSAIARYFKFKGLRVSGYDRTPSPLTDRLQAEGIEVHSRTTFPAFLRMPLKPLSYILLPSRTLSKN